MVVLSRALDCGLLWTYAKAGNASTLLLYSMSLLRRETVVLHNPSFGVVRYLPSPMHWKLSTCTALSDTPV